MVVADNRGHTMAINCHLSFNGNCEEAMRTYHGLLGGEIITMLAFGDTPHRDEVPAEWHRRIIHATLKIDDQELLGSDAFPEAYAEPSGFFVTHSLADLGKARGVFESLSQGGRIVMPFQETFWSPGFGVVIDRFRVPWEINCEHATEPPS
jgi:PhnB protein